MKINEIRTAFLKYFENKGHTLVESSSLVPHNDPTLLFTNAGMVQFKDLFLGKETRSYVRATTSQKCVRAGGKHNDLENVGFTARHHTFFEMLGNFSFGDYFKKEAIHYAWEFITKELKLPPEKLYVSVYEKDDEAAQIWHTQEGIPLNRICRLGEKDNFWSMGDTGPCGPCTEIYMDRGEEFGCGKSTCQVGCDCDRFMEFWNLVFMQFDRSSDGKMTPLPKPSVDTGAGLERIGLILQKVETNYDTDIFQDIISKTAKLCQVQADPKNPLIVSFRVIADHARATTFLVADGVMPGNEGRGYVLRRIMRRAIRHGKKLGFSGPFLNQVVGFVIDQMKNAYPDLIEKKSFIQKIVFAEEEQFFRTVERGLSLLDEEISSLKNSKILSGEVAFKLYDTYGFPLDLTRVICEEKGLSIDEAGFEKCMDRQKSESRKHWKGSGEEAQELAYFQLAEEFRSKNVQQIFTGYESLSEESKCLALLSMQNGQLQKIDFASSGEVFSVFEKTPFYGESGGQSGDQGWILGKNSSDDFKADVKDVTKPLPNLIVAHLQIQKGSICVGKSYLQNTNEKVRSLTAKNHTATHLLQWALRKVLGEHVKQSGSLVNSELLRFDFTHFQPMTAEEIIQVEKLINEKIWSNFSVSKKEMKKEEAVALGAIAFFGEKYGHLVRVIQVGDFSTELCGGTHVNHSSDIHLFKIVNENGIASGVRRIIAYTSEQALEYLNKKEQEVKNIQEKLKASSSDEILTKIEKIISNEKDARKQIEQFQSQKAGGEIDELIAKAENIGSSLKWVSALCEPDSQGIKKLRDMAERIKQKYPQSIIVLGMKELDSSKAILLACVGSEVSSNIKANEIIQKSAPLIEGKGGGKSDLAQAGGTRSEGLEASLQAAKDWVFSKL